MSELPAEGEKSWGAKLNAYLLGAATAAAELVTSAAVTAEILARDLLRGSESRSPKMDSAPGVFARVADQFGRTPWHVDTTGLTHMDKTRTATQTQQAVQPQTGVSWSLTDAGSRGPIHALDDGTVDLVPAPATQRRIVRHDPRDTGGHDAILLLGQSNAQGHSNSANLSLDISMDGLYQLAGSGPQVGQIILAEDPMWAVTAAPLTKIGPGMEFGRQLLFRTPANRKVLLLNCGQGSTGVVNASDGDYSWDPGNVSVGTNLTTRAVAQINLAKTLDPKIRFRAIYWAQGERDQTADQALYTTRVTQIINLMYAAIGYPVPLLIPGLVPEHLAATAPTSVIQATLQAIAESFDLGVWLGAPTGFYTPGDAHWTAAGARFLGRKAAAELFRIQTEKGIL